MIMGMPDENTIIAEHGTYQMSNLNCHRMTDLIIRSE